VPEAQEEKTRSLDILLDSRQGLGAIVASALLGLLLTFVFPLSVAAIIDRVIVHNALSTLQIVAVVLFTTAVFEGLVSILRGRIISFKTGQISARLASLLIRHIFTVDLKHLLGQQGRRTVETVATINLFKDSIRELIDFFVQICLSVTVYSLVLFVINAQLFGFLVLALVVQVTFLALAHRRLKPLVTESIQEHKQFSAMLHTAVGAIETLKVYGAAGIFEGAARQKVNSALAKNFHASRVTADGTAFSRMIARFTEATIVTLGAFNVIMGTLTIGQLIAFQMFAIRFFEPFGRISLMIQRYERVRTFFRDWDEFLAIRVDNKSASVRSEAKPDAPVLHVSDLSFRYDGAKDYALRDVSMDIAPMEVVFILGPSGSGKSTLVRLLSGLLPVREGVVEVRGVCLQDIPETERRSFVACALQEPMLLPGAVAENVSAFDARVSMAEVRRALRITGCEAFVDKLPARENTLVGENYVSISGGERQRLCLARMCASNAALQIIDEGTSGLHRQLEVDVLQRIIDGMQPHQATIVITHREDLAVLGTRILRIDEGRLVADSAAEPVLAKAQADS